MARLVIVTLDLSGPESPQYKVVREGLAALDLHRFVVKDGRKVRLPYNTAAGRIEFKSSTGLRDSLAKRIEALFRKHRLRGKSFIAVGGRWAWGKRVT